MGLDNLIFKGLDYAFNGFMTPVAEEAWAPGVGRLYDEMVLGAKITARNSDGTVNIRVLSGHEEGSGPGAPQPGLHTDFHKIENVSPAAFAAAMADLTANVTTVVKIDRPVKVSTTPLATFKQALGQ